MSKVTVEFEGKALIALISGLDPTEVLNEMDPNFLRGWVATAFACDEVYESDHLEKWYRGEL